MKALLAAILVAAVLVGCSGADTSPSPGATLPPVATLPPPATATPVETPAPTPAPTFDHTPRPAPSDATLAPQLQRLLDDWLADSATPGGILGARLGDGSTAIVASGWRDAAGDDPVEPTDRFRIGSITKTFVATLVLDLAADDLIDIAAPLADYLPDAPHADEVTIRQLLAHTSGMPDFFLLSEYQSAILVAPGRVWEAAGVLGLVSDPPLDFEPGTDWAYSNTNYLLLGMVAEEVTGDPLARLLREHVSEPLGLADTYLDELEPAPAVAVAGHHDLDRDGEPDSLAGIPYTALVTSGAAAGGLSATALDVLDFADGVLGGDLLSDEALAEMLMPTEHNSAYGLGIGRLMTDAGEAWGHTGALPGFSTVFARSLEQGLAIVVLANRSGADVEALGREVAALLAQEAG